MNAAQRRKARRKAARDYAALVSSIGTINHPIDANAMFVEAYGRFKSAAESLVRALLERLAPVFRMLTSLATAINHYFEESLRRAREQLRRRRRDVLVHGTA